MFPGTKEEVGSGREVDMAIEGQHEGSLWCWKCSES